MLLISFIYLFIHHLFILLFSKFVFYFAFPLLKNFHNVYLLKIYEYIHYILL